jgi:HEPN domain-containing protein
MAGKRRVEAHRWLMQAKFDLQAARWNLQGGFHATACFLAQQSGEKALKSVLHYLGARKTALLTHSLLEMVKAGEKQLPALSSLAEEARQLDLHYIPSRYPNALPSGYPHAFYSQSQAEQALGAADKILQTIQEHYRERGEREILAPD